MHHKEIRKSITHSSRYCVHHSHIFIETQMPVDQNITALTWTVEDCKNLRLFTVLVHAPHLQFKMNTLTCSLK